MINGIINIYKEKGFTSHDVVAKLRGILQQKKIGHTGTLDPDAEGVLPVCLGKGTKVCDLLTNKDKVYRAELLLGVETDTQDTSGNILQEKQVAVSEEQVCQVIEGFVGTYNQIPPMYSALKFNGKKLYELARAGIEVERQARPVTIHSIRIIDVKLPVVTMEVVCSKGTYIRTLCHDIGQKLGCGGCMQKLLRTRVDIFTLEQSLRLDEVQKLVDEQGIASVIMEVDAVFEQYQKMIVKESCDRLVHNGNAVKLSQCQSQPESGEDWVRIYDSKEQFVGVYQWREDRRAYIPVKIFWETK